jgi:uncharacterized protein DUF6448
MRMRWFVIFFAVGILLCARTLSAHCDTLSGPVVADAKQALARSDVTPVLKWVRPADESAVRSAFAQTLRVRGASDSARELADRWFFETVVRLHRASEGEPFTGIKTDAVAKPLALADASIESGDADELIRHLSRQTADTLRAKFAEVHSTHAHADESVAAGRRYVAAYVSLMHYIEQLTGEGHAESAADQTDPRSH